MGTTPNNWQIIQQSALPSLGKAERTNDEVILSSIDTELNYPLRASATFPVADSKLNFAPSYLSTADGANKVPAPVSSQVSSIPGSTVDFQTQATTGATFVIAWPGTNTVGRFRRVGFTLLGNGSIQALFSDEAATLGALANPGTLFVKSGTALSFLDLECTDTAGKFKTAGSATAIIENSKIYRFGSGAGGSGGSGNANSFQTYIAQRLDESYFTFADPVIPEMTGSDRVESATSAYNLVDSTYDFSAAGQNIISKSLMAPSFLKLVDEARQVELHAEWFSDSSIDLAATYEIALDGINYQAISMVQVFSTQRFIGRGTLANPASVSRFSQLTNNSTKELNVTSQQSLAQKITTTTKNGISQVRVNINKAGNPSGSYVVKLSKDNSGSPGSVLYSVAFLISNLATGANAITMDSFKSIIPPGDYWISIDTDATYKASFSTGTNSISIGADSAGSGYAYNGATWTTLAAFGMYFDLWGHIYDLKVRITSSGSGKKLKAFAVLYDEGIGAIDEGLFQQQSFIFSGDTNQSTFTITRFLPDSRRLKIFDISKAQVYMYPAFSIDGRNIKFPDGLFSSPGETINLVADQSQGVGYDYSDINGSLLTANHLGSTDATIDRSIAGRGPLLRDEASVLKEAWIDTWGNLNITNPKG